MQVTDKTCNIMFRITINYFGRKNNIQLYYKIHEICRLVVLDLLPHTFFKKYFLTAIIYIFNYFKIPLITFKMVN